MKYNEICEAADTECFSNVKDKKVERRCAASADTCTDANSATCKKCKGANCNTGIFPDGRKQCYQCNGTDCADVTSHSDWLKVCLNFVETDECYMFADDSQAVTRGCKSDDGTKCSDATKAECELCSETKCNDKTYDTKFTCIACRSDEEQNCWNNADKLTGKPCRTTESSKEDGCFHGIWSKYFGKSL